MAPTEQYELQVKVQRGPSEAELGIIVEVFQEEEFHGLHISEVKHRGLIAQWNRENPEAEVSCGQWIVSVNGVRGAVDNMFEELRHASDLDLVVSWVMPLDQQQAGEARLRTIRPTSGMAPHRFRVRVHKGPGEVLGCNLDVEADELRFVGIGPGLVLDWNGRNPGREVKLGDSIIFVNGVTKDRMLPEIMKGGPLTMIVSRGRVPRAAGHRRDVLTQTSVSHLPCIQWHAKPGEDPDVCGICLQEWEEGMPSMTLPCRHVFHPGCLIPWLTQHSALCPNCGWAADCEVMPEKTDYEVFSSEAEVPHAQRVPDSLSAAWRVSRAGGLSAKT